MMSVKEYANDVNLSVKKIMELASSLGITINNEDDMLDDDAIIMLDNEIANHSELSETEEQEEDNIEEIEEDYDTEYEEERTTSKQTSKKKSKTNSSKDNKNNDFLKQRKEMYKHKDKLKSNNVVIAEDVVLYKEGMTVSEFANSLNVSVGEVIKKLMALGLMMNLNQFFLL